MNITVERRSIELGVLLMGLFLAENIDYIDEAYKTMGLRQTKELYDFTKIIKREKAIDKEKLSYYFKNYNIYNNSLNYCINCIMDINCDGKNFEEYIEAIRSKNKKDIFKHIIFSISEAKSRSGKKAREYVNSLEKIDEEVVMEHINGIKDFYEYKWKLAELMNKGQIIYKEFAQFLGECREILKPHIEKMITIGEQWADYIDEQLSIKGVEFINSIIETDFNGVESIVIYPEVIECYNCCFYSKEGTSSVDIEFGYRVYDLINSFKGKDEDGWFFNVLKCLSDGSRYEMLRVLSEKEMYGGELAAAMKLSVGTISYHTTNLLVTGLIKEKRVNSRIYYETDKEKLLKWSRLFEERFKKNAENA